MSAAAIQNTESDSGREKARLDLAQKLLREAFAESKQLGNLGLEAAGSVIEEFETAVLGDAQESYDRCKLLYLELLMEFENSSVPIPPTPLNAWFANEPEKRIQAVPPAVTAPATEDSEIAFTSTAAREHYQISRWFFSLQTKTDPTPPKAQLLKLQALYVCYAAELEIQERTLPLLKGIWPDRDSLFLPHLEKKNGGVELQANVRLRVDAIADRSGQWLPDGKFPLLPFTNAVRYCLTLTDVEHYRPSILEVGMFFLLFGMPRAHAIRTQAIDTKGLNEDQVVELSFRLMRLQKNRNRVLCVHEPIDRTLLESIGIDLKKIFFLWNKMKHGKAP